MVIKLLDLVMLEVQSNRKIDTLRGVQVLPLLLLLLITLSIKVRINRVEMQVLILKTLEVISLLEEFILLRELELQIKILIFNSSSSKINSSGIIITW